MSDQNNPPLVGIIMGSQSDWETMQHAANQLDELGVPYEAQIISAHRTPDLLFDYASTAELIADFRLLYDSLLANGGEHVAHGTLEQSIRTVAAFGLTLTTLDVREHAQAHHAALGPLIDRLGEYDQPYASLSRPERFDLLAGELASARPLGLLPKPLEGQDLATFRTFESIKGLLNHFGEREHIAFSNVFYAGSKVCLECHARDIQLRRCSQ